MIDEQRAEPGRKYALAFTALVHLGLLAALFLGVQWKRSQPEVMEVELWSSQPAPAMPAPPPPPPEEKPAALPEPKPEPIAKKPDITLKEEKKPAKPEPKKPEPKPEPPKPEPKKPEAKVETKKPEPPRPPVDPFKEALEREERQRNAANIQAKLNAAADAEQRAAAGRRGLATWSDKIKMKIRSNLVPPPGLSGNPVAVFAVTQLPSGEIIDVRQKRPSNFPAYDTAIERAIWKSSPLPKPDDPALFQRVLDLTFCPDEERGCR